MPPEEAAEQTESQQGFCQQHIQCCSDGPPPLSHLLLHLATQMSTTNKNFAQASKEEYHSYGAVVTNCHYRGVAGEDTEATLFQGQLSACIQHPCFGIPCLAHLWGVLELLEEADLCSSHCCGLVRLT